MSSANSLPKSWHRARLAALAAGVSLCFLAVPFVMAQNAPDPATLNRSEAAQSVAITSLPSFAPLVKKVMPAVVNISVTMKADATVQEDEDQQAGPGDGQGMPGGPNAPFDQFLRKFFEQQQGHGQQMRPQAGQAMALGSGFIIDPSGYVVTNNHVVENAAQKAGSVTVIFQDDTRHVAKVVGRDPKTDLALLKIDAPQPLPYVQWGDSATTQVGDWVLAVGNPFGLGGTVSSGVVSARGRDIHSGPYDDFLQIDASINRGNSGGPTFSLDGKVIGINTAIYSPNGGSVGIGFAIPSSIAQPVIQQLREHGKVERGWLGVQIQEVTPDIAASLHLPKQEGALVADVTKDGPAAKIGVKQGDVIMSYDGHDVAKLRDLPLAVAETTVGAKAQLVIWRDGHEQTLAPVIAAMPNTPQQMASNESGESHENAEKAMGLSLAPLDGEWRQRLHVAKDVNGVVVTGVANDSPLAALGVQQGDVIEAINSDKVATPAEAASRLAQVSKERGSERTVLILLNRHGVNQYVAMTVHENSGDNG
jgi:serine protease Do